MAYRGVRACVSCGAMLSTAQVQGVSIEGCSACGGVWIPELELLALLHASPDAQQFDELMEHNDGSPRRPCPVCSELMNLAWIDFLQLDRCPQHGVWLDRGELYEALHSKGAWDEQMKRLRRIMSTPKHDQ
jgi:Zn-finger nucleic acid-binding protein